MAEYGVFLTYKELYQLIQLLDRIRERRLEELGLVTIRDKLRDRRNEIPMDERIKERQE